MKAKEGKTISSMFAELVKEIELTDWPTPDEKAHLVNVYVSDLASRHHDLVRLIKVLNLNARDTRGLFEKVIEKLSELKSIVLDKCKVKRQIMSQRNVFDEESNVQRLRATFRTLLAKKFVRAYGDM